MDQFKIIKQYELFYNTHILPNYDSDYLHDESIQHNDRKPSIIYSESMYIRSNYDWFQHLNEFGWTVVDLNIDVDTIVNEFYDYLELRFDGFDRHNSDTFSIISDTFFGIISDTIGHTRFAWECRKACISIFERIYGTNKLLTSFDGGNFLHPNVVKHQFYIDRISTNGTPNWLHLDQLHPQLQEDHFYQGIVNLLDNGPSSGGLIVVEGSHHHFNQYYKTHPLTGLSTDHYDIIYDCELQKLPLLKICAKPGQLILWDSRTIHCNCYPADDHRRMCTYVSMAPRSKATQEELTKRIEFFENRIMTSHAPYGIWLTPKEESIVRSKKRLSSDVEYYEPADDIIRSLVGY